MFRPLLLALLLVALPAAPAELASMKSILLVARRDLPDPFFRNSVVLITQSSGNTPIGVIVNRATDVPLSKVFPDVERLRGSAERVFFGGPVMPDKLVALFRAAAPREGALEVLDGVYLATSAELFRELLARDQPTEDLRVFAGFAGWAPGQLEAEVARGDWHLASADAGTLFGTKHDRLWQELEGRAKARKTRFSLSSAAALPPGPAFP